jgi:hypothetical protein
MLAIHVSESALTPAQLEDVLSGIAAINSGAQTEISLLRSDGRDGKWLAIDFKDRFALACFELCSSVLDEELRALKALRGLN